jgi:amino acid adenylation domain-containing protein
MLTQSERAQLTAQLRRDRTRPAVEHIQRRDPALKQLPASSAQEQVWFIDQFAPGQATYNIPCAVSISGPIDVPALCRALGNLTERHESLRTRLVAAKGGQSDGRPVQVIDDPTEPDLAVVDLADSELRDYIHAAAMRPFNLATGPLLRTSLARLSADKHVLVAVVHHTVFDGWSAGVFLRDLAALYHAEVTGGPSGLTDLPVQFADYAVWERDRLRRGALTALQDYWQQTMAGFETIQFPADHPRPAVEDFAGGLTVFSSGTALLAELRNLARDEGATVFTTVFAALLALLHRYTGQTDLVVGTASANRGRAELAPMIGFLVNTVPIRADLSGDPTFTELLGRVKEATVGAFGHQDLPFGQLVETLGVPRDASRAPVFQIVLSYAEPDAEPVPAGGAEFLLTNLVTGLPAAKFDLTFGVEARGDGLQVECSYKTSLFEDATIRQLLTHLETLLHGIVAQPAARLSELPMLTEAELHAELTGWNNTSGPTPAGCAHERFEAQVAATPDAVAARHSSEQVTYAELNRQANQIARRLRDLGVGPESLVGVRMRTSLRRLATFIGIWKAGGGYVPLDVNLPSNRINFMIADTGMKAILTDDPAEWDIIADLPDGNLPNAATTENTAYVIYTSGSTGQPKGVVIEHRNLVNLAHAMSTRWKIGPGSRVLQFASFTFDVSVMDMFMPLLAGGTVILAAPDTLHSPPRLAALLRDERVTFAGLPPAVLNLLPEGDYPDLRTLMAAGEELPTELAKRWIRPGLQLVNGYGPTEATVIATQAEIDADTPMPPPIGFPVVPNYHAYVLDQQLNPVPVGVTGELHLGGAGIARGYLNRPELTAERFVKGPSGERLYKTGDLVKRRPDGSIVYLGRIDNQIKLNGIRIELGEIEAALTAHPAIAQAVVTTITSPAGEAELAGYVRTVNQVSETEIRDHLARMLPATMIPAHLITLDTFPLNLSGKIDRAALPAPGPASVVDHAPPTTLLEMLLADIFATILGLEQVGATDSFFDLGGSSLRAMSLVSALGSELEADIGTATVFLAPTPRQLAALLRTEHGFDDQDLDG